MAHATITAMPQHEVVQDFREYLERSLRDPFTINLKDLTLMETIRAAAKAKSRLHTNYTKNLAGLVYNIKRCSGHTDLRIFDNYVRDDN